VTPVSDVHHDDLEYVSEISGRYHRSLRHLLSSPVSGFDVNLWVNRPDAAAAAESKILQLSLAARIGFPIPRTLISNDKATISAFLDSPVSKIQKSLAPYVWLGEEGRVNNTARVTLEDLPGEKALSHTVEIYQDCIDKRAEVRAFFMGSSYFALKMTPLDSGVGSVDWRILHLPGHSEIEHHRLSPEVEALCRAMMNELGIVTASFDLMIANDGSVVFAELNQAGQFLWMDAHGLPVLDAFCEFLASGDPDYEWRPSGPVLDWASTKAARHQLLEEETRHRARSTAA